LKGVQEPVLIASSYGAHTVFGRIGGIIGINGLEQANNSWMLYKISTWPAGAPLNQLDQSMDKRRFNAIGNSGGPATETGLGELQYPREI
jgi:hypothetical protein